MKIDSIISQIPDLELRRKIRLMTRLSIAGAVITLGIIPLEWMTGFARLAPATLAVSVIYLCFPFLACLVNPLWSRLLFVTFINTTLYAFTDTVASQTPASNIVIVTMALPALFFAREEMIPIFLSVGESIFFFMWFYLRPGGALGAQVPSLPMGIYLDLSGFVLAYFGVRYFQRSDAANKDALRTVVNALPDLVFTIDRNGHYLTAHCPPNIELIMPPEKFIGKHYMEVLPPPLSLLMDAAWKELFRTGLAQNFSYDAPNAYGPDGGGISNYEARIMLAGNGEVLVLCQDVTARVRSQKAFQESEKRFRQIVETTHEGIWMINENSITTFVNDRLATMLGYRPDEIVGKSPLDFVAPDFRELLMSSWNKRKLGLASSYDCKYLKKDGTPVWTLVSGSPIRDDTGKYQGVLGMHVDITERKRMEAEIVSSSKMSALGLMSSGIAHEINNPLTVIHGRAVQLKQLASSNQPIDRKIISTYAEKIESTAIRISKIVKALRSISRETNEDPFQTYSVNAILADALELCQERFRDHGIALDVNAPSVPLMLNCRPGEICQIILNFLNNAHDAVQSLPDRWVRIDVTEKPRTVEIAVTDSGKGISPEIREKILQPFFTTKDVGKGTGLGLSVSKGLAESHGGNIFLDQASTRTRFVLILPKPVQSA